MVILPDGAPPVQAHHFADKSCRPTSAPKPGSAGAEAKVKVSSTPAGYFDLAAIKAALTVPRVLQAAGVILTDDELARCATCCPIHGGDNPGAFTWYDDGRRWHCFTGCGAGGDVLDLITALKEIPFEKAVKVAAILAGVEPGAPPDQATLARRKQEQARKAEEQARRSALRRDSSITAATKNWWDLLGVWTRNVEAGRRYLRSRSIETVVDSLGDRAWVLNFWRDGSPCTPIYSFERGVGDFGGSAIVNIATRRAEPGANPKVLVLKDAPTRGTFGRSEPLAWREPIDRVVLVEGVIDFLTALITFGHMYLLGRAPIPGRHLVLGAHSVSGLHKIIDALANDAGVGGRFRSLPILLVSHQDGPGGAGEQEKRKVFDSAKRLGMTVSEFDLGGHKDLNDWYAATIAPTAGSAEVQP